MGFGGRQALSGRQEKGFWNSSALCNLCHSISGARDLELVVVRVVAPVQGLPRGSGTGPHSPARHFNLCWCLLKVSFAL